MDRVDFMPHERVVLINVFLVGPQMINEESCKIVVYVNTWKPECILFKFYDLLITEEKGIFVYFQYYFIAKSCAEFFQRIVDEVFGGSIGPKIEIPQALHAVLLRNRIDQGNIVGA